MQITVCKVFKETKNKQKTGRKRKLKKQIFTLIELLVKETCFNFFLVRYHRTQHTILYYIFLDMSIPFCKKFQKKCNFNDCKSKRTLMFESSVHLL